MVEYNLGYDVACDMKVKNFSEMDRLEIINGLLLRSGRGRKVPIKGGIILWK